MLMGIKIATLIEVLVGAIPALLGAVSVFIGSKQAREFHNRTGDDSLLTHLAAFSTFKSENEAREEREKQLDLV